jgi:hypothetical protein
MNKEDYKSFKDFRKHCEHLGTWIGSCHHPTRYKGVEKAMEDMPFCHYAKDCPLLKGN